MTSAVCVACRHAIDAAARVCPYCGADPSTGQKPIDTQAIIQEIFKPRELSTSESMLEYARQRQGIVIAITVIVVFLILTALHQFVTARNQSAVSGAPAVPLTEITDLSNQPDETEARAMPDLNFQYEGRPQAMRTLIVEPGAVTPPEVIMGQQAVQQGRPAQAPPATPRPDAAAQSQTPSVQPQTSGAPAPPSPASTANPPTQ